VFVGGAPQQRCGRMVGAGIQRCWRRMRGGVGVGVVLQVRCARVRVRVCVQMSRRPRAMVYSVKRNHHVLATRG